MVRIIVSSTALLLLAVAAHLIGGQGAVSLSNPGQEDLTFWVNHNGLEQIDVEGQLGFGDAGRMLMRRRSNAPAIRAIRDRFVFRDREFSKLPADQADQYVIGAGRVFNLIDASGRAYRILEQTPGKVTRQIAGREITFDVRPLVRLKVRLSEPARVYLTGADGLGYAPRGSINRFAALPAEQFFHSNGSFEIDLPAGETTIEAVRGIEYKLARRTLDLRKPIEVTLKLERWVDMAAQGWYSSDAHIHANYTAPHHQVVTAQDVLTYTLAEDLNIPNMMVANSFGGFLHDTALFEGKPHKLSNDRHILYWNEEMRNSGSYGHMCFYGLTSLVEPLYTGFRDTPYADDYPPNYTQAKTARAQGGAVTYAHPGYSPAFEGFSAKELPVDAALGEVDAMDVMSNNPEEVAMENWYRLLNAGIRLGISAGTDSFTNVADHYTPGAHRVYAHLDGPLRYRDWIAAYKRGRTFATNGPMITFTVDGKLPGDEITFPAGSRRMKVNLKVNSEIPVEAAEIVVNGKPQPASGSILIDSSCWIAARVKGPWNRMLLNDSYAFAHTSPIYVVVGGKPIGLAEDARFWMEWIDKLIQRVEARGRFSNEQRKREVIELFRKAREVYASRA
jgi:hypothetical protein